MKLSEQIGNQIRAVEQQLNLLWGWQSEESFRVEQRVASLKDLVNHLEGLFKQYSDARQRRPLPPMGVTQAAFLCSCVEYGSYGNSGWIWESRKVSQKLAESLVRRGMLKAEKAIRHGIYQDYETTIYVPTDAGKEQVASLKRAKQAAREALKEAQEEQAHAEALEAAFGPHGQG